jgi:hypothetical protein
VSLLGSTDYSGRKITESLGKSQWEGKKMERTRGSAIANSLSEHVQYNWKHLLLTAVLRCVTSAAWTCFTSYNTRKGVCSLSLCAIVLRSSPPSHVSTCHGQRSSQLFCVHYTLLWKLIMLPIRVTCRLSHPAWFDAVIVFSEWRKLWLFITQFS